MRKRLGRRCLLCRCCAAWMPGEGRWSQHPAVFGKERLLKDSDALKNAENIEDQCYYKVSDVTRSFQDSLSHKGTFHDDQWLGLDLQAVFIPATEMLSHADGFLAVNQKYNMPFDRTQTDIVVNASLPETREFFCGMSRKQT